MPFDMSLSTSIVDVYVKDQHSGLMICPARDNDLSDFAFTMLTEKYLRPDETPQMGHARAARAWCGDDLELAQRLYEGASKGWFMWASPVLANAPLPGEKVKGMPISCYLNYVDDSLDGIMGHSTETRWLAVLGGGVGGHWRIRGASDKSPGAIPFVKTMDADMEAYRQGKCYSPDTEVMTVRGWVRFDQLRADDMIGAVSNDRTLRFEIPRELIVEDHAGEMINVRTKNGSVDLLVTPNHSMVIERKRIKEAVSGKRRRHQPERAITETWSGELEKLRADALPKHSGVRMHTSVTLEGEVSLLSAVERFQIAFQADGTLFATGGGFKLLSDWVQFDKIDAAWCNEFLNELAQWDSHVCDGNRGFTYSSIIKENADVVQAIASLAGRTSRQTCHVRDGNRQDIYTVYVRAETKPLLLENVTTKRIPYEGKVYCALVSTGMLLVRRNGVVTVCGNTRRGSYAAYMDVSHPDVREFLSLRIEGSGDISRKCHSPGFNHGLNISDAFMEAVDRDTTWSLIDPNDNSVREVVNARELWQEIINTRVRSGEPYLYFIDTARRAMPETQRALGLNLWGSNLCSEITLATSIDRTAVCCLSSLNAATYLEWKHSGIVADLITMLDNVLEYFIQNAPPQLAKAVYSASRERALGLGLMGFHSLLQGLMIPFESEQARELDTEMMSNIKANALAQSYVLGGLRGEAPDMKGTGLRNSHLLALAPNANSAILLDVSPATEPSAANAYLHETRIGGRPVKNKYLIELLETKGKNTDEIWNTIITGKGSVQHLDFLSDLEKSVFKTAIEINQMWVVRHAADRQPFVCQAQSVNLFFPGRADPSYVNLVHLSAWRLGLKSLYYFRTVATNRADNVSNKMVRKALVDHTPEEECVSCHG